MTEKSVAPEQQYYYVGIAAVVVVILVAIWLLLRDDDVVIPETEVPPATVVSAQEPDVVLPPPPEIEPEIVSEEPQPVDSPADNAEEVTVVVEPLPALDHSDPELRQKLLALNWKAGLASLFVTDEMIRSFVVQTDNLAQGQLVTGHPLLQPLEQSFVAIQQPDGLYVAADSNFKRYEPYLQLLESVPPQQLLPLFQHYLPLFEQAYAELGYPDGGFQQRLLQAIDVLLATPDIEGALLLERPSVMYTFADDRLESLPAAQKQLVRMNSAQQQRFKALLRSYRQVFVQ